MQDPILITGCARSGTSLVAGAINICGAFGGDLAGPNRNNAKGMFENLHIRNSIAKSYLKSVNADPLGQYPLPDIESLPIPNDWRARIESVMQEQGYKDGPWFYKGAKMCLMWPVWHYAFPNAKWIIVRRRTGDIARSCVRTGFMKAFMKSNIREKVGVDNEYDGWIWWVRQHEQRFREMIEAGLNVKVVWPERMVQGDYQQLFETVDWLRLKWSSKVLEFIDPKLWRSRAK
jgi:hypothetical protein